MADAGVVRRQLRREIEHARRDAAERRRRVDRATREFESLLERAAVPAFRLIANVLRSENLPFEVQNPAGAVRLVSERTREDVIALELDAAVDPPQPVLVATRAYGRRTLRTERPLKDGVSMDTLTEEDVIARLIEELRPWLE